MRFRYRSYQVSATVSLGARTTTLLRILLALSVLYLNIEQAIIRCLC